jgi:hypothetical protein
MSMKRFDSPLHPDAKDVLVFDFSPSLPTGVTLSGVPTVTAVVHPGTTDANPSAVLNGAASLDATSTKVLVPVVGAIEGNEYEIEAKCATTSAQIFCALTAILQMGR